MFKIILEVLYIKIFQPLLCIETPAHIAIRESQMWGFQTLLKGGCKIDINTFDGESLAHYAVRSIGNSPQFLRILASKGGDLNVKNKNNETPFLVAKEKKNTRALTALKELGVKEEERKENKEVKETGKVKKLY